MRPVIIAFIMKLSWLVILFTFIVIAVLGIIYWWNMPRLLAVFPPDGQTEVPAGTAIRLTFSRPMDRDSISERLSIKPNMDGSISWQENKLTFTPGEPWHAGETIQVQLDAGGRATSLLSLPLRSLKSWSFSIRQPSLVYLYPSDGPVNLFFINPRTEEIQQLTDSPGGVLGYHINTNGSTIYYSVDNQDGSSDIYRIDISSETEDQTNNDGTSTPINRNPELVLNCPGALCRSPHISPKGDYLTYERTASTASTGPDYPQVLLLPLNSEDSSSPESHQEPTPAPVLAGESDHQTLLPDWSPDGLLTFYDSDIEAFVFLDPRSGESTIFSNQTGMPGSWHPNGRDYVAPEIIFMDEEPSDSTADLESYASSHLILFNRRDRSSQDLTAGKGFLEDTTPVFSPDGSNLAFARKFLDNARWTPGRQLWLLEVDKTGAVQYTDNPNFNHFDFAWSPDGSQLAYVRFNQTTLNEATEIWLIDTNNGLTTRLVQGGFAPQWIH
ncbi:MAG: Ig-like domain-containing protein [Anaerolineales bacterium]